MQEDVPVYAVVWRRRRRGERGVQVCVYIT
jgi:hypothetical protein